jgi:hypothetical protein
MANPMLAARELRARLIPDGVTAGVDERTPRCCAEVDGGTVWM